MITILILKGTGVQVLPKKIITKDHPRPDPKEIQMGEGRNTKNQEKYVTFLFKRGRSDLSGHPASQFHFLFKCAIGAQCLYF